MSKLKTLRLTFIEAESERSLQPSRSLSRLNRGRRRYQIETLTSLWPTWNFGLIAVE